MSHVTFETARRLAEAGYPQPKKPQIGQTWIFSFLPDTALMIGSQIEGPIPWHGLFHATETFLPTATDILAHLPGWNLAFTTVSRWICYWEDIDGNVTEFIGHENPAEAAAEAWFFEQTHAKE